MLRGPQTLGELKQRSEKLHQFADLRAVEQTLERLTARELGRWLERRPGQKEARYTHLLTAAGDAPATAEPTAAYAPPPAEPAEPSDLAGEIATLRREVEALREEVAALREQSTP